MIIDTHCHLYAEEFNKDRDECIQRAIHQGIEKILLPNIDSTSIEAMYHTEQKYPDICYAMMGLHPTSVKDTYLEELSIIEKHLSQRKFVGIGEIGMDLYWDKTYIEQQKIAFKRQLEWACQYRYPVSIHCRNAFKEVFEVLDGLAELPYGVFHCFTGTYEEAQKIMAYGTFKLGIGGVVTFQKSHLPQILKDIDLSYIVVETDAPYLAPVPYRGKRNEPAYMSYVVQKIASIKHLSVEEVALRCKENSLEIFFR